MVKSNRHRCTLGLLLATASCGSERVAPPVPRATAVWVDTLPPVPTSYLDVPVRYDLAPALRWLESEVPVRFGDLEERKPIVGKKRMRYAYAAERSPFRLVVDGRTAMLQADVKYRARAWYNPPVLPEISAKCGKEGEEPRARLTVETNVELTRAWTLRPRTQAMATPLSNPARDRCKVTFLRIDVTGKVMDGAREALAQRLAAFDAKIAAFDLPSESSRLWGVLGSPLKLTDSLWLVINPATVRIGMLKMHGDTLVTTIGISANPRVIGGSRPDVAPPPLPEPQDSTSRPPVLHLLTEGRLPYDVGTKDLLTGTLAWLAGGQIEQFLRTRVRIKLAPVLAAGRDLLEKNLNRDLANGVHLAMDVKSGRVLSVRAAPAALLVRAVASGQGELVLDLKPEQLVGPESLGAAVPSR
jgi:hypothetical protein